MKSMNPQTVASEQATLDTIAKGPDSKSDVREQVNKLTADIRAELAKGDGNPEIEAILSGFVLEFGDESSADEDAELESIVEGILDGRGSEENL